MSEIGAVQKNAHLVDLIRSRKMLENKNLLAKVGVDTAKNEPEVSMILVLFMFSPSHARDNTGAIWQTTGQVEHAERQHPREAA